MIVDRNVECDHIPKFRFIPLIFPIALLHLKHVQYLPIYNNNISILYVHQSFLCYAAQYPTCRISSRFRIGCRMRISPPQRDAIDRIINARGMVAPSPPLPSQKFAFAEICGVRGEAARNRSSRRDRASARASDISRDRREASGKKERRDGGGTAVVVER